MMVYAWTEDAVDSWDELCFNVSAPEHGRRFHPRRIAYRVSPHPRRSLTLLGSLLARLVEAACMPPKPLPNVRAALVGITSFSSVWNTPIFVSKSLPKNQKKKKPIFDVGYVLTKYILTATIPKYRLIPNPTHVPSNLGMYYVWLLMMLQRAHTCTRPTDFRPSCILLGDQYRDPSSRLYKSLNP